MLDEAKGANCDGVLSVQLVPGTPPDRVGIAQFTLLDLKRVISAAAIDSEALARRSQNERARCPRAARQSSERFHARRVSRRWLDGVASTATKLPKLRYTTGTFPLPCA